MGGQLIGIDHPIHIRPRLIDRQQRVAEVIGEAGIGRFLLCRHGIVRHEAEEASAEVEELATLPWEDTPLTQRLDDLIGFLEHPDRHQCRSPMEQGILLLLLIARLLSQLGECRSIEE